MTFRCGLCRLDRHDLNMPEPFTTYKGDFNTDWWAFGQELLTFRNYFYWIGDQIEAENWAEAKVQLYNLGNYIGTTLRPLVSEMSGLRGSAWACMNWIDENWPSEEPTVTMSAILDAMWDAEVHEPLLFIAVVDAMRSSILNRTIDLPTFARYVRHFSKWV